MILSMNASILGQGVGGKGGVGWKVATVREKKPKDSQSLE